MTLGKQCSGALTLTDELSMLKKLKSGVVCWQWLELLKILKTCKVTFIYVPEHSEVEGNEGTDKLAGLITA